MVEYILNMPFAQREKGGAVIERLRRFAKTHNSLLHNKVFEQIA